MAEQQKMGHSESFAGPGTALAQQYIRERQWGVALSWYRNYLGLLDSTQVDQVMVTALLEHHSFNEEEVEHYSDHPLFTIWEISRQINGPFWGIWGNEFNLDVGLQWVKTVQGIDVSNHSIEIQQIQSDFLAYLSHKTTVELLNQFEITEIMNMDLPESIWQTIFYSRWNDSEWSSYLEVKSSHHFLQQIARENQGEIASNEWNLHSKTVIPHIQMQSATWSSGGGEFVGLSNMGLIIVEINTSSLHKLNYYGGKPFFWNREGTVLATPVGLFGDTDSDLTLTEDHALILGWRGNAQLIYTGYYIFRPGAEGYAPSRLNLSSGELSRDVFTELRENRSLFIAGREMLIPDLWVYSASLYNL